MKHKFFLSAACLCMLSSTHTNGQEQQLYGIEIKCLKGHRFEIAMTYDDTTVTLKSEKTLDNVYIVIKDIDGNIIYNGWTAIDNSGNIISLPVEEGTEKYTIEVYKDEECVKEYFE